MVFIYFLFFFTWILSTIMLCIYCTRITENATKKTPSWILISHLKSRLRNCSFIPKTWDSCMKAGGWTSSAERDKQTIWKRYKHIRALYALGFMGSACCQTSYLVVRTSKRETKTGRRLTALSVLLISFLCFISLENHIHRILCSVSTYTVYYL